MTYDSQKPRTKLLGSVASLAAFLAFATRAEAQSYSDGSSSLVDISGLDGVVSATPQADGSVLVVMEDGSQRVLAAGDVVIEGGVVFADPDLVMEASAGSGGHVNPYLVGAGIAGAGLIAAAASDGYDDDDDDVAPPPANNAPSFTSPEAVSVDENSADTGYTATADDADGDDLTFSVSGGADADRFQIDAGTGALSFVEAPDFETDRKSVV